MACIVLCTFFSLAAVLSARQCAYVALRAGMRRRRPRPIPERLKQPR